MLDLLQICEDINICYFFTQERQRIRELEQQRVKQQEEDKKLKQMIDKHNSSLNKQKLNTSAGSGSSKLNSTFNKSYNPDS